MADKDPKSPATTSYAYDTMVPRWAVIETLLGGTEAMRAAGEAYLPRHEEETDVGYAARLTCSTLLNITEQTLDTLSAKPFCEPVKTEDVPPEMEDPILDNVDLQGNNLDVFARAWFKEGLAKALCHVLVDMPRPAPRLDGQPRTLADDRSEGVRPYWVLIKPEHVLFARAEVIDGKEVLKHVRILECYSEQDGFAEVHKRRIRVLEPGTVTTYIPKPRQNTSQKEEWVQEEVWETGLDYIPMVTFYSHREDFMVGKPPLLDLAHLNVAHWQSTADQRHILKVARFPILACSGSESEDSNITIGPNKVMYVSDPQGKFYYVEHQGNAIEAGRKDLEDLERQMAGYGAEFLESKPGNPTATAKAIDSAESSSSLAAMVGVFEDALTQALDFTADWMKLADGGEVELVKDFSLEEADAPGLDALDKARTRRDISRVAYLRGLISRGVLPEDFDLDEDLEEIQGEAPDLGGGTGMDLNPGDNGGEGGGDGKGKKPGVEGAEQ